MTKKKIHKVKLPALLSIFRGDWSLVGTKTKKFNSGSVLICEPKSQKKKKKHVQIANYVGGDTHTQLQEKKIESQRAKNIQCGQLNFHVIWDPFQFYLSIFTVIK